MKHTDLPRREVAILKAWRACESDARMEERGQALVDVSSILGWLTSEKFDRKYLLEMTLNEFDRASTKLGSDSTIRLHVAYYRALLAKQQTKKGTQ